MSKPLELVVLDDAVRHLRDTFRKNRELVPPSLAGMICGIVSYWGRKRLGGADVIYPGVERMMEMGPCGLRQAKTNLGVLRNWGFLEAVAYPSGGRRATRYVVHVEALVPVLVDLGVNPSPELVKKLRNRAVNRAVTRAKNRAVTAHGIQGFMKGAVEGFDIVDEETSQEGDWQGQGDTAGVIPFPGSKTTREAS